MANMGDVTGKLKLSDEFSVPIAKMQQSLLGLTRQFAPMVAGFASIGGVVKILKDAVDAASGAESVVAALNSAIVSTGGSAGKTTDELRGMARELSKAFGIEDEAILEAQTSMMKFSTITGDTFDRMTRSVIDMAARMKMGLGGAAQMVGRALESPTNGMMMLARSGVIFSSAQKQVIKDLVESGQLAKAQGIILDGLESKFKGAAAAARDTFAGSLAAARVEIGELSEALGTEIIPLLRGVTEWVAKNGEKFTALAGSIGRGVVDSAWIFIGAIKAILLLALSQWLKKCEAGIISFADKLDKQGKAVLLSAQALNVYLAVVVMVSQAVTKWVDVMMADMDRMVVKMREVGLATDTFKDVAEKIRKAGGQPITITQAEADNIKLLIDGATAQIEAFKVAREKAIQELKALQSTGPDYAANAGSPGAAQMQFNAAMEAQNKIIAEANGRIPQLTQHAQGLAGMFRFLNVETVKTPPAINEASEAMRALQERLDAAYKAEGLLAYQSRALTAARKVGTKAIAEANRQIALRAKLDALGIKDAQLMTKAVQEQVKGYLATAAANYDRAASEQVLADATAKVNAILDDRLERDKVTKALMDQMRNNRAEAHRAVNLELADLERNLKAQKDYREALIKGSAALKQFNIDQQVLDWQASKPKELFLTAEGQAQLTKYRALVTAIADEAERLATEMGRSAQLRATADIFGDIDARMGSIANKVLDFADAMKGIKADAGDAAKQFAGWADLISAGVGVLRESGLIKGPGGGTSQFGGQMSGTYSAEGAMVGAIIGAIVGTMAYGQTAAGAAIGSAIGEVMGSMINKGADEGLVSIYNAGRDATSKFVVAITGANNKLGRNLQDAATQMIENLQDIVSSLGGELQSIAAIDFKVRDDKISVFVNGIKKVFKEMDEAMSFAMTELLRTAETMNVDALFKSVLQNSSAQNLDALKADLDAIAKIISFGFTDSQNAIQGFQSELNALRNVLIRTTTDSTQLARGLANLGLEEARRWQSTRDNITGEQRSNAEKLAMLKQDAEMWNAEKAMRVAELQLKAFEIKEKLERFKADAELMKSGQRLWNAKWELDRSQMEMEARLFGIQGEMYQADLDARAAYIEAQGALLQVQLDAINQLAGVLASMPNIDVPNLRLPNAGGGGGAGGFSGPSPAEQRALDFDNFLRTQALAGLSQYAQAVANLTAAYAAQAQAASEVAGGEAALQAQRLADMARLRDELIDGMGLPLEAVRDRMAQLTQQADDFYASNVELQRQWDAGEITLEEWLAAIARTQKIVGELADQARHDLSSQALYFTEAMGMDEVSLQLRKDIADMEWALKLAEFQLTLETYHNLKRISDEMYNNGMALIGKINDWVPSEHWDTGGGYQDNTDTDTSNPVLDALKQALDRLRTAVDGLRKSNEDMVLGDKSPLTMGDQFFEAKRRYDETLALARGGNLEAIENFASVREQYLALAASMFGTAGAGYQSIFQQSLQAGQDLAAAGQAILDAIPPQMAGTEIRLDNIAAILTAMSSQMGVSPGWNPGPHPNPLLNPNSASYSAQGQVNNVLRGNFGGGGAGNADAELKIVNENLVKMANAQESYAREARNDRLARPTFSHAPIALKRGA